MARRTSRNALGCKFADPPSRGSDTALAIDVTYHEDYTPTYTYDEDARLYTRFYNGEPQTDYDGKPITCANVIVQFMPVSYRENDRSNVHVKITGSGPIDAFIEGTHIRGVWVQEEVGAPFRFLDDRGEPVNLLPGKTFIQIVPMSMTPRYRSDDGVWHTLTPVPENTT